MARFILKDMELLSTVERAAKKLTFHPQANLITGDNDTGKSSLLKSIYWCFGAEPATVHDRWKSAGVKGLVRFEIDGIERSILRDHDVFTIFDQNSTVSGVYSSVTSQLAPAFAKLVDFQLTLQEQSGKAKIPPPAFYFLPFYLDQDAGWTSTLSSFARLKQFRNFQTDLLDYHAGVKPNDYYRVKGEKRELSSDLEEPNARRQLLWQLKTNFAEQLGGPQVQLDLDAYKNEIQDLLDEVELVRDEEQKFRSDLVELRNREISLQHQFAIVVKAKEELHKDYDFAAVNLSNATVACPTCGEEYENSFAERFAIAQNEERCSELRAEIAKDLEETKSHIVNQKARLSGLKDRRRRLNELLATKRGEVSLAGLIKAAGKKELRTILSAEADRLSSEVSTIEEKIAVCSKKMAQFDNRERKATIREEFVKLMNRHLLLLDVQTLSEKSYRMLAAKIKETGSDLPRALLAYFFSILHLIYRRGSAIPAPVIIDSPNQQDQDDINFDKIMEFIRDNRPKDCQLILGQVDTREVEFPGKTFTLSKKYHALLDTEFEAVSSSMSPFIQASLEAISQTSDS